MRWIAAALACAIALALMGCASNASSESSASMAEPQEVESQTLEAQSEPGESSIASTEQEEDEEEAVAMRLNIDGTDVAVEWEDNESVAALAGLAADGPLTVQMSMYGGFEQVGPLGTTLPSDDAQTTTSAGDIVLYSGDQIVVFYGSNSWAYTRLGLIAGMSTDQMADLLGNGDVALTITIE